MCGINGIMILKPETGIVGTIHSMNSAITHRGPDDNGIYSFGDRIAFGMQRLSIIDVQHGHQPMYNKDKTIAIVFNGEIYNSKRCADELEAEGHVFETRSDTEVIIHLYENMERVF
jgi:asparagine synthase (glutamine-hydrolysing)